MNIKKQNNDYKLVFVILHYILETETSKCIDSIIERIDFENYDIVVVDNFSQNDSVDKLKKKYELNKKIHFICNSKNMGFTGGNNVGFLYAKKELKADFICMLNNDTYLIQDDFFETICMEYRNSKFGVMGPEIHLPNNQIEKINVNLISKEKLKLNTIKLRIYLLLNFFHCHFLINKFENRKKNNKNYMLNENSLRIENVILHGCCLIFSPKYIKKFNGLDQKTFLYREEEFLYLKVMKNNMITVYNPNLKIFHNEKQSTSKMKKNIRKSRQFRYKNLLKANKILLKELGDLK